MLYWHDLGLQPRSGWVFECAHHGGQKSQKQQRTVGVLLHLARHYRDPACKPRQQGSGDQDDPPAAVMVGDVAAIEDEADTRDRLHKPKPCQIKRIMRQLIDLETQ